MKYVAHLRQSARRACDIARRETDPSLKDLWARRAFDLAQLAEAIERRARAERANRRRAVA